MPGFLGFLKNYSDSTGITKDYHDRYQDFAIICGDFAVILDLDLIWIWIWLDLA